MSIHLTTGHACKFAEGEGDPAADPRPQTAKQAAASRLKGHKVDAGSVRINELAETDALLSTGLGDKRTGKQQASKGSTALRDAAQDQDEQDEGEQASENSQRSRSHKASIGSLSEQSQISSGDSDSREAALPRDQRGRRDSGGDEEIGARQSILAAGAAQRTDNHLGEDVSATVKQRAVSKRIAGVVGSQTTSADRLDRAEKRDDRDLDQEADEVESVSRQGRHGQRPNASGDRAGASSGSHEKESLQTERASILSRSRESSSTKESIADEDADDRELNARDSSSSSAHGKAASASASEKGTRSSSSTKSSAALKRSGSEAGDSSDSRSSALSKRSGAEAGESKKDEMSRKEKATLAVRPALKGYKLSWDLLETEQAASAEGLNDDPTRWSWQPTAQEQPGEPLMSPIILAILCKSPGLSREPVLWKLGGAQPQ